jgi:hypothetical protein
MTTSCHVCWLFGREEGRSRKHGRRSDTPNGRGAVLQAWRGSTNANRAYHRKARLDAWTALGLSGTVVVLEEATQPLLDDDRRQHVISLRGVRVILSFRGVYLAGTRLIVLRTIAPQELPCLAERADPPKTPPQVRPARIGFTRRAAGRPRRGLGRRCKPWPAPSASIAPRSRTTPARPRRRRRRGRGGSDEQEDADSVVR